jgi:hypothetical protein
MRQVLIIKRDKVKFIDCTASNIKRLEAIYTLLFKDLVIMFGKMGQRLVETEASFFGDIGSGFDGVVVLLGKFVMINLHLLSCIKSIVDSSGRA